MMSTEVNVKTTKFQKLREALIGKQVLDTIVQDVSERCYFQEFYEINKTYLELEICPKHRNNWEMYGWHVYMDKELYKRPKLFPLLEFVVCDDPLNPNGKWLEIVVPNIGETTLNKI